MKGFLFNVISEKGKRKTNQDSATVISNQSKSAYLLVLADGMGGYKGGELASKSVVEACQEVFDYHFGKEDVIKVNLKQILNQIFQHSQEKIAEVKKTNTDYSGMGTTLACVLMYDDKVVWGNIGDSRIYLYNDDGVKLISKDHSLVQDYLDKHDGKIPPSYLAQYSNVLTKSIGGNMDLADIFPIGAEHYELNKEKADGFLLCSDGLIINKSYDYSLFFDKTLKSNSSLESTSKALFDWAINNGSTDNISIILFTQNGRTNKTGGLNKLMAGKKRQFIYMIILIGILGVATVLATVFKNHFLQENNTLQAHKEIKTEDKKEPNKTRHPWKGFSITNNKTNFKVSLKNPKETIIKWHSYNQSTDYMLIVLDDKETEVKKIETGKTNVSINDLDLRIKGAYSIKVMVLFNDGEGNLMSPNSIKLEIID